MNLDPAVKTVPFGANIDIRDTVDYKEVRWDVYGCVYGLEACFGDGKKLSMDRRHESLAHTHAILFLQVMRQYQLGPNGAIMTSLNLFATRFDQVSHQ